MKKLTQKICGEILGQSFKTIQFSDETKVISFDVFDTLIIRSEIADPSDLFSMFNQSDQRFKEKRLLAEKKARQNSRYNEIRLTDIYEFLPEYDYLEEIDAEISVCKANKPAFDFFNSIKTGLFGNKKIVITSDMYLGSEIIRTILGNCGYDLGSIPIYVSSEYRETKRNGKLFRIIEEDMKGLEAVMSIKEVMHIGDSIISDYIMPKSMGIKAILYNKKDMEIK